MKRKMIVNAHQDAECKSPPKIVRLSSNKNRLFNPRSGGRQQLIVTLNEGVILERLSGIDRGHGDLLTAIDRWLESKERSAGDAGT